MLTVVEKLLDSSEVEHFRTHLKQASWRDGGETAGGLNVFAKRNQQADPQCEFVQQLANQLLQKMGNHPTLVSACLPQHIFPPVFNRYALDQEYATHVDAAIMQLPTGNKVMRSDVSCTLFLSEPDDYDGGELVIEGQFGAQEVCLEAGDAVIYPSSSLHRVNAVRSGVRLAAVTWLQSMVADAEMRSLLFELDQSVQVLTRNGQSPDEVLRLTSLYHNLVRRNSIV